MNEKIKFIARLIQGEKMTDLCREFNIARKTGYKFWIRYKDTGADGLMDRARRPLRYASQLPPQVEQVILRIKNKHSSWGAPKIKEILSRKYPNIKTPARSTIHAILDRHGFVKRYKRRRHKAEGTTLSNTTQPNNLWCADYKGEFMLGNRQ